MARFRDTKLYDLLAAAPLTIWYGAAIVGVAPGIGHDLARLASHGDLRLGLGALAKSLTLVFLGLQILLFALRKVPEGRSPGWRPRAAALLGSNLPLIFLALPQVQMSLPAAIASSILVATGTGGAILGALWLGRGFSIFPQARQLTTTGPYRFVRHPIYLCEQLASFGAMLQFAMPWTLVITLAGLAAQFPRMHYEEAVLSKTFSDYRAYAARTRRLLPGLY